MAGHIVRVLCTQACGERGSGRSRGSQYVTVSQSCPKTIRHLTSAARQTKEEIYDQQPRRVPLPRAEPTMARPSTSYSTKSLSSFMSSGWDAASRATTRASVSLLRPKTADSHQQLIIGAPTDFRKVDSVPAPRRRRGEFRPLELSIYLPHNRLSPLPDFSRSDWNARPADLEIPRPAKVRSVTDSDFTFSSSTFTLQRKPVESASFLISPSIPDSNRSTLLDGTLPQDAILTLPTQLPTVPSRIHSSSLMRSGTQSSRTSTGWDVTSPKSDNYSRPRAVSEPVGASRRRSNQSRGGRSDIDDAINELNTIVEERRADKHARPDSDGSPRDKDHEGAGGTSPAHVPAIAPSMKMRVRTETLSDIGSALSVPHTGGALSSPSLLRTDPHSRQLSRSSYTTADIYDEPLMSPPSQSSTRARLTNWIRTSIPFSPTRENAPAQLDVKSPTALLAAIDLPPVTPPHFRTTYKHTNHPLYSCPAITPPRDSFSSVTASPRSSVRSSPSKTARTVATSFTELEFDSSGKKSFEAGRSISDTLERERALMMLRTGKEIEGLGTQTANVGVAY